MRCRSERFLVLKCHRAKTRQVEAKSGPLRLKKLKMGVKSDCTSVWLADDDPTKRMIARGKLNTQTAPLLTAFLLQY